MPVLDALEVSVHHLQRSAYRDLGIAAMRRPDWVVSHILTGEVTTSTGGGSWRASSGDVMIHPPDMPFAETAPAAGVHQWMGLDARMPPAIDLLRAYPVPAVVRLPDPATYAADFDRLLATWEDHGSPTRALRLHALAAGLLAHVLDGWHAAGCPARPGELQTSADRFLDIIAYMRDNLGRKITREDLASIACLHPGYFDRAFRAAHGAAPMQMLRDLRLSRARDLLATTAESLEAIADLCGFGDPAHFSRAFRARFGQSPGRFREGAKTSRESYIPP